jgi:hypothetical protein
LIWGNGPGLLAPNADKIIAAVGRAGSLTQGTGENQIFYWYKAPNGIIFMILTANQEKYWLDYP